MPFGNKEFREGRCNEGHTVPKGLNTFISLFRTEAYYPIWMKFGLRDLYTVLFSICVFFNLRRRTTLLWAYIKVNLRLYSETVCHFQSKERL